ncbi:hypothetical protein PUR29_11445 [Methylobacterium ajmalii]|uniref:Uncharacterized protein n=1 Tax=Methylobacterium ajmalii TaxID=2738439 RepID=A0ABU9ZRQ5_9HYPH
MRLHAPKATGWALIRCSCGCGSAHLLLMDRAGDGLALMQVTAESLRRIADAVEESAPERPALAAMQPAGRA